MTTNYLTLQLQLSPKDRSDTVNLLLKPLRFDYILRHSRKTVRAQVKAKRVVRKWSLERLEDKEVKLKYQNAIRAEVSGFSESIQGKIDRSLKGQSLVSGRGL